MTCLNSAYLENTGKGLNDWIFAVNHWDKATATAAGGFGSGFNICQVISPTMPQFNWELANIPSNITYVGSGVWITPFMASPHLSISAELKDDQVIVKERFEADRSMVTWCANYGYNFPLDLFSNASGYSYNIASAIIWDKKLNIFTGRTTVVFSTRPNQLISDYIDVVEYGITPYLKEDKLLSRLQSQKAYSTALISPDRKHVLFRQRFDQFQYDASSGQFEKSVLLTQEETSSDSQSKQIINEVDLRVPDGTDYEGYFYKDPLSRWIPNNFTLYHSGVKDSTLKAFHIMPTNWWSGLPTLADLEAVTKIDPQTGKGGVTVYEFAPFESESNKLTPRELIDKRIVIDKVKKLGYEEDPTLKIWSFNYYPEKPFE